MHSRSPAPFDRSSTSTGGAYRLKPYHPTAKAAKNAKGRLAAAAPRPDGTSGTPVVRRARGHEPVSADRSCPRALLTTGRRVAAAGGRWPRQQSSLPRRWTDFFARFAFFAVVPAALARVVLLQPIRH
jgi:hypothetical protein